MRFITIQDKHNRRCEINVEAIESLTCINGTHTQIRTVSRKTYTVEEAASKIGERIAHAPANTEKVL